MWHAICRDCDFVALTDTEELASRAALAHVKEKLRIKQDHMVLTHKELVGYEKERKIK